MGLEYLPMFGLNLYMVNGLVNIPYMEHMGLDVSHCFGCFGTPKTSGIEIILDIRNPMFSSGAINFHTHH